MTLKVKGKEYQKKFIVAKKWSGHGKTADYGPALTQTQLS